MFHSSCSSNMRIELKTEFADRIPIAYAAAYLGFYELFREIFESGAFVSDDIIKYVIHGDSVEIIQLLRENGFDFDHGMILAAELNAVNAFRHLCYECEYSLDELFAVALKHKSIDVLHLIIKMGTPLFDRNEVLALGDKELTEFCFANCDHTMDEDGFLVAVKSNNLELAKLLAPKCDVNAEDEFGSAIHYATLNNNKEMIQFLLQIETLDINKKASNGDHVLHIAARNCDEECVAALLSHKSINRQMKNAKLKTPFQIATSLRKTKVARLLLLR